LIHVTIADTSVWIDHLRLENPELNALIAADMMLVHPWVMAELACGSIRNRKDFLSNLVELPGCDDEDLGSLLNFIEAHRLYGRGLSVIDCQLLAACVRGDHFLWTKDKPLEAAARGLKVLYY
jgi:predicted nucleic acid-binding protein